MRQEDPDGEQSPGGGIGLRRLDGLQRLVEPPPTEQDVDPGFESGLGRGTGINFRGRFDCGQSLVRLAEPTEESPRSRSA